MTSFDPPPAFFDETIFLKSQEITDINSKSSQNAYNPYEMYQLVNL